MATQAENANAIAELKTNLAVVVQRLETHDKTMDNLDQDLHRTQTNDVPALKERLTQLETAVKEHGDFIRGKRDLIDKVLVALIAAGVAGLIQFGFRWFDTHQSLKDSLGL